MPILVCTCGGSTHEWNCQCEEAASQDDLFKLETTVEELTETVEILKAQVKLLLERTKYIQTFDYK